MQIAGSAYGVKQHTLPQRPVKRLFAKVRVAAGHHCPMCSAYPTEHNMAWQAHFRRSSKHARVTYQVADNKASLVGEAEPVPQ